MGFKRIGKSSRHPLVVFRICSRSRAWPETSKTLQAGFDACTWMARSIPDSSGIWMSEMRRLGAEVLALSKAWRGFTKCSTSNPRLCMMVPRISAMIGSSSTTKTLTRFFFTFPPPHQSYAAIVPLKRFSQARNDRAVTLSGCCHAGQGRPLTRAAHHESDCEGSLTKSHKRTLGPETYVPFASMTREWNSQRCYRLR